MLVLANGAFKSGSTWLREITLTLRPFDPIPQAFQHPQYSHWIDDRKLAKMLRDADTVRRNYLSKSHIYDVALRNLLVSHTAVRVLNIQRDMRDVLVSHYFHLRRIGKGPTKFADYYWRIGRLKAVQIWRYHEVWDVRSPNVHLTSFERLKTDFDAEVERIGRFIGAPPSRRDLVRIREETSLRRLREKMGEAGKPEAECFFRRGEVGGWSKHLDRTMLDDLETLKARGLGPLDGARHWVLFEARPRMKRFLLGRLSPALLQQF